MVNLMGSRRHFLTGLIVLGGGFLAAAYCKAQGAFDSPPEREQTSQENSDGAAPVSPQAQAPMEFSQIHHVNDISSNAETFVGLPVADYRADLELQKDTAYRFRSTWDEDTLLPNLQSFLSTPGATEAQALLIGAWFADEMDRKPDELVSTLVRNASKLPRLRAIYFGDIISEEAEMSWIQQTDLWPLLQAFPRLEVFRCRSGAGLSFSKLEHEGLRALALESGGLDRSVVLSLSQAQLPNLEHLEIWLGTEDYGGNTTLEDLSHILSGEKFPKLKYLGLRNSDKADSLAQALVKSPIVERLEVLDLSLGTLSDTGGEALLGLQSPSLKSLNLHHNYMSAPVCAKLQALAFRVDVSEAAPPDWGPEDRFVAVGE